MYAKKWLESLIVQNDKSTQHAKVLQRTVEDAGKAVRLGFNTVVETAVEEIGDLTKAITDNFSSSNEQIGLFKAAVATGTGALTGFCCRIAKNRNRYVRRRQLEKFLEKLQAQAAAALTGTALKHLGTCWFSKSTNNRRRAVSGGITYLTSDQETQKGRLYEAAGSGIGSFGGGVGGALYGASLGAVGGPIGVLLGGILGGMVGSFGGEYLGKKAGTAAHNYGFADGGIIRQPTLAMIGEGTNDEAVIPLKNNRSVPVDINLEPIAQLSRSVEQLVQNQNMKMDNTEIVTELKKLNKLTDKIMKLSS